MEPFWPGVEDTTLPLYLIEERFRESPDALVALDQ
jgi:hypothetical protein